MSRSSSADARTHFCFAEIVWKKYEGLGVDTQRQNIVQPTRCSSSNAGVAEVLMEPISSLWVGGNHSTHRLFVRSRRHVDGTAVSSQRPIQELPDAATAARGETTRERLELLARHDELA